MSRAGTPVWLPAASRLAALGFAALGRSWRIEYAAGYAELDARLHTERCIYALWHARLLPLVYTHRHRGVGVLISRHRDGELIARVTEALGYRTARGSSTRGAEAGVLEMLTLAAAGHSLAITPDGPRGPARRVKPGLTYLAGRTGWPVVPVAAAARPAWVFDSWDRFMVPRPWARVHVAYGEPIRVPSGLDEAGNELWRSRIEAAIEEVTARVTASMGERA